MTRNEKSGAAALPVSPVTGTSADMLFRKAGPGDCAQAQKIICPGPEGKGGGGLPQHASTSLRPGGAGLWGILQCGGALYLSTTMAWVDS